MLALRALAHEGVKEDLAYSFHGNLFWGAEGRCVLLYVRVQTNIIDSTDLNGAIVLRAMVLVITSAQPLLQDWLKRH